MLLSVHVSLDSVDVYGLHDDMFPRLTTEMMSRASTYGSKEKVGAFQEIFSRGERNVDLFIVIEGELEILVPDSNGASSLITKVTDGQFTGELDMFSGRAILVNCRTARDTQVLRISREDFRRLNSCETDIAELMLRAYILRRAGLIQQSQGGVLLVGPKHDGETHRIHSFLLHNGYPHQVVDTELMSSVKGASATLAIPRVDLPAVVLPNREVLYKPSDSALANALGIAERLDPAHLFDVVIVGAGPAGLAAAVYGASEGLSTLVIEGRSPGGQAGTSSKIENYLGFPMGISGGELASRAQIQAQKFGARLLVSSSVCKLDCSRLVYQLELEDGTPVTSRAIVVATGARYRKLEVPGCKEYENQGVFYAATVMEASLCAGREVVVIGGGNSAGQAAVFLAKSAAHVHLLVRGDGLAVTMSSYLVQRIQSSRKISVHYKTEITQLRGDRGLEAAEWTSRHTGCQEERKVAAVFVMTGAEPNTGWLGGCLPLDGHGFVIAGSSVPGSEGYSAYATSRPGIFAVGDVRSGSVKRVASAVGEGSVVIAAVHAYLASHELLSREGTM